MHVDPTMFKSYDIRGIYGQNLDEDITAAIGKAFAKYLNRPSTVIVGRDGRISGPSLHRKLIDSLTGIGINVIDIGLCSTDMF
jgi:phosphomannomutase